MTEKKSEDVISRANKTIENMNKIIEAQEKNKTERQKILYKNLSEICDLTRTFIDGFEILLEEEQERPKDQWTKTHYFDLVEANVIILENLIQSNLDILDQFYLQMLSDLKKFRYSVTASFKDYENSKSYLETDVKSLKNLIEDLKIYSKTSH